MKNSILNLITEITEHGEVFFEKKILKKAAENMEVTDLIDCTWELKDWLKGIKFGMGDFDENFSYDYIILEEPTTSRFVQFYKYCPDLKEIFVMEADKIKFNPKLSDEEKQEIIDFVDENYDPPINIHL